MILDPHSIQVSVRPSPLSVMVEHAVVPFGGTVADILRAVECGHLAAPSARAVAVIERGNDIIELAPDEYGTFTPIPGDRLGISVPVRGGGGGGGKSPIAMLVGVAAMAAAAWAAPAIAGALTPAYQAGSGMAGFSAWSGTYSLIKGIAMGGIGMLGSLAAKALSPPQTPKFSSAMSGLDTVTPVYSITGSQNRLNKWGPIPQVFGRHRVWPTLVAEPYTEKRGDEVFFRQRFAMYGPLKLSEFKIGETPIDSFEGVEMEYCEGWPDDTPPKLYADGQDFHQEGLSISLRKANGAVTRRTTQDVDEVQFDIGMGGLYEIRASDGKKIDATVRFKASYSLVGSGEWTDFPEAVDGVITITGTHLTEIHRTYRAVVARGQYDLRWERVTDDHEGSMLFDSISLNTLRTVTAREGIRYDLLPPLCVIDLVIKASGSLTGVVDTFNLMAEAYLPVWDEDEAQYAMVLSRSPAWAMVHVLRGPARRRPAPDSRIDSEMFAEFAAHCETLGVEFNAVIDQQMMVRQLLADIASIGRGGNVMRDNLYSVVIDGEKPGVGQSLTPRNSWGFKGSKDFTELPHALRCRFINEQAGYQPDELYVYADGYDESTATLFEDLDVWGLNHPDQVWLKGRFHFADAILRPETFERYMDWENMRTGRGGRVKLVSDVILVGSGSARVRNVRYAWDDVLEEEVLVYDPVTRDEQGRCLAVDIDSTWDMEEGTDYAMGIRLMDGVIETYAITGSAGSHTTIYLVEPIPATVCPEGGELVWFGPAGREAEDCVVTKVDPGPDLTAKLTLRHYAYDEIQEALSGPIPPFDTKITKPASATRHPAAPVIRSVRSDESVLLRMSDGTLQSRMVVAFSIVGGGVPIAAVQAQYRNQGGDWQVLPQVSSDASVLTIGEVVDGTRYDVRLRCVSPTGKASPWALVESHRVVGQLSLPPDVPQMMVSGRKLVWPYDPPQDFAGFRVKYGVGQDAVWDRMSRAHGAGLISAAEFDISGFAGAMTFAVRAVDRGGRESARSARVYINLGDALVANVVEEYPLHPVFDGSISGGHVDGGELVADGTPLWTGEDDNIIWTGVDHALFWAPTFSPLEYVFSFTPEPGAEGATLTLRTEMRGNGLRIQYATDSQRLLFTGEDDNIVWTGEDDAIFWSGPNEWRDWPGKLTDIEMVTHYFRITASGGAKQAVISEITCCVDVEDQEEIFEDVQIEAGGTRLPTALTWHRVKIVSMTLQDDGGSAAMVRVVDKDISGPLIEVLDGSGTTTTGIIDATIQGY
ncbi:TipJ family phage tail tip protein [Pseudodesulfovibrio pelocollis]|uniref:TipJ family phage tail tip protein n=1 Tax=Pseudodesulfovibrio pelocollis TaxID=3051432 RepID=UPI00255AD1F4|nr:hypothetical protein [Pseudodesulfovibrio sp. SB368]